MALLSLARIVFALLSLLVLGLAAYLLVEWWQGETALAPDGTEYVVRETWLLVTGLALAFWSVLGRWVVLMLLARPSVWPSRPERGQGQSVSGPGGDKIYVEAHGRVEAPVVIFTHGWGLDSTIWNLAKRDLAHGMRMITWDLPGLGRSTLKGSLTLAHLAQALKAVMAQAEGRPVILVGHSIGGMAIQTLARDEPDLVARQVAGIVLLNTTYTNPLRTMVLSPLMQALQRPVLTPLMHLTRWFVPGVWIVAWQSYLSGSAHMAQRLGFGPDVTRSQLDHVALLVTRNSPGVQARGNLAMFDWGAEDALAGLGVPTLVLAGDRDIVTRAEAGERIAAGVERGQARVIRRANHMGPLEQATAYHDAIAAFVREVCPDEADGHEEPRPVSPALAVQWPRTLLQESDPKASPSSDDTTPD